MLLMPNAFPALMLCRLQGINMIADHLLRQLPLLAACIMSIFVDVAGEVGRCWRVGGGEAGRA